jgi:hypothetical protein
MGFLDVAVVASGFVVMAIYVIQTQEMEWGLVSMDALGRSHIPGLSPLIFGIIRGLCAISVWAVIVSIITDRQGLTLTVLNLDNTKRAILLKHFERLSPFTVWSWILQGIYFTLTCYCSIYLGIKDQLPSDQIHPLPMMPMILQRIAWVLFEISFPVSFLVSMIVSFVLIPGARKNKMPTDNFFKIYALVMHNCNILYMAGEFIANQLPFVLTHITFMHLYAIGYAIFSWIWHYYKGFYYYFFLDYNRSGAFFWYFGLLFGVSLLFLAGYGCAHLQNNNNHTVPNVVSYMNRFICISIFNTHVFKTDCFNSHLFFDKNLKPIERMSVSKL